MSSERYDLFVIGSGPAGQKAAIAAAKLDKRVGIVDGPDMLGGVCLHTGTIPSKTLREAVLYLTGFRQRAFYGRGYTLQSKIEVKDLMFRVQKVVEREKQVVQDQLSRNDVEVVEGSARFRDPHELEIESGNGVETVSADHLLIACGTRPANNPDIPFGERVFDSDHLAEVVEGSLPKTSIVVGAGVIGLEYASVMAALGIRVTIIDSRDTILDFVDQEMISALTYHLRRRRVTFRLGEKVESVSSENGQVTAVLESGKQVRADQLLYAVGRQPNTDRLNLDAAGLQTNERGRIQVDKNFQTQVPHIYAASDVIGFPMLASTSMEQGRIASCHMFGEPFEYSPTFLPYGIYTIPEVAMVGKTEQQLTADKVPYDVGLARYEELTKAQMMGDETGMLKLIFHRESLELLGVHIIGGGASELLHIGQTVLALGGGIEYLRDSVFNYPTLAQAYKVAALDGYNKL